MIVCQLIEIIEGEIITNGVDTARRVFGCCGADLMSDVLASIQPEAVLLTGLCNPQIVRTAQMADITAIVLVRGKTPPQETIDLAEKEGIPLITTPLGMFEACGRLYAAGLRSKENSVTNEEHSI